MPISSIIKEKQQAKFLIKSLVKKLRKTPILDLIYRGSKDGWSAEDDFHRLCDGKGPTLTIIKVKETGKICGGYTSVSWSNPSDAGCKPDIDAYVFSVDAQTIYHTHNPSQAVWHSSSHGPWFSGTLGI